MCNAVVREPLFAGFELRRISAGVTTRFDSSVAHVVLRMDSNWPRTPLNAVESVAIGGPLIPPSIPSLCLYYIVCDLRSLITLYRFNHVGATSRSSVFKRRKSFIPIGLHKTVAGIVF